MQVDARRASQLPRLDVEPRYEQRKPTNLPRRMDAAPECELANSRFSFAPRRALALLRPSPSVAAPAVAFACLRVDDREESNARLNALRVVGFRRAVLAAHGSSQLSPRSDVPHRRAARAAPASVVVFAGRVCCRRCMAARYRRASALSKRARSLQWDSRRFALGGGFCAARHQSTIGSVPPDELAHACAGHAELQSELQSDSTARSSL